MISTEEWINWAKNCHKNICIHAFDARYKIFVKQRGWHHQNLIRNKNHFYNNDRDDSNAYWYSVSYISEKNNIRSYKDDHFNFKFLVLFLLNIIELKKNNDIQYVDFAEIDQIMF